MAENKVNWNTVLVVLVVGVVGYLVLSGGVFSGRVTGVTSKIGNLDTTDKQAVLTMLSKCTIVNVGVPAPTSVVQTGDYVCGTFSKKCISNFIGFDPVATGSGSSNTISQPISCNDATNNYPKASWARTTCCSP